MELKSFIQQKFNDADSVKKAYDRKWLENLLFTYGNQWLVWDDKDGMYTVPAAPSYINQSRVVANRIFSVVRSVIVKLVNQQFEVIAVPLDPAKKNVAEVCSKILNYVFNKSNIIYELAFDLFVFGKTFVKCIFNPDVGDMIGEVRLGDIELEHLTPFEVFVDPLATSMDDARYCFVVKLRDVDYVRERYGVDIDVKGSPSIPYILQRVELYYGKKPYLPKNLVVVKEFWCKSTKEYPDGLFCILANDEVIKVEDNPYKDSYGKPYLPIVDCNFFVSNNQFVTTSLVEQLISLQKEYNSLRSEIMLQEKLMTRPKWLIPNECNVSRNSITSEPGEKIYYDSRGGVPQQIQGVPPSAEFWQHLSFIKNEFDDLAGLHDVSRGRVPSGVRSYIAIQFLQEQDTGLLSITRENIVNMYVKLGYMILRQAKQFFVEDRVLPILRSTTDYEMYYFKRSVMEGFNESSIRIIFGSVMPESVVARQQFILSLYQLGLITSPNKVLELLGMPTIDIIEDTKLDEKNAETENRVMSEQGVYYEVNKSDNHQIHLQTHYNFMKTPEYRELSDEVKNLFNQHTDTHQKLLNLQLMTIQQLTGQDIIQPIRKQRRR